MRHLIQMFKDWLAPMRVADRGEGVTIEPGAAFDYPRNIKLADGVRVARHVVLRANTETQPGVSIGARTLVLENALINANQGHVRIGAESWIGPFCLIYGNGGVDIGDHVLIAAHSSINTVSHHTGDAAKPMAKQGIYCDPVVIEDDVWLGLNVTVLQGVRIGRGSIIGAGSVVTRNIPPYSIALGTPARVIRSRDPNEARTPDELTS